MKIILCYNKLIKVENHTSDTALEAPDNCTVRDLLNFIKLPSYLQKSIIARVNNEPVWNSTIIREGDTVKLVRTITGG